MQAIVRDEDRELKIHELTRAADAAQVPSGLQLLVYEAFSH